jgi:hypothetical protein
MAISDKDFMQKLAASLESDKPLGKDDNKSNPDDLAAYEAFLATQLNTTEEDYQKIQVNIHHSYKAFQSCGHHQ